MLFPERKGHELFTRYHSVPPWEREADVLPKQQFYWNRGRAILHGLGAHAHIINTTSSAKLDAALRMLRICGTVTPASTVYFTGSGAPEKQSLNPGEISRIKLEDVLINNRRFWGIAPPVGEGQQLIASKPSTEMKLAPDFTVVRSVEWGCVNDTIGIIHSCDARLMTCDGLPIHKAPHADAVVDEVITHLSEPNTLILESGCHILFPNTKYMNNPSNVAGMELTFRDVLEFDALDDEDIAYLRQQKKRFVGAPGGMHLSWLISIGRLKTINGMDISNLQGVQAYLGFASKGFHPLILSVLGAHDYIRGNETLGTLDTGFVSSLMCSNSFARHQLKYVNYLNRTFAIQDLKGFVDDYACYGVMHALNDAFGPIEIFEDLIYRALDSRAKEELLKAWKLQEGIK